MAVGGSWRAGCGAAGTPGKIGVKAAGSAAAPRAPGSPERVGPGRCLASDSLVVPPGWRGETSPYRAVSRSSACLSFLLLSAALLGPGWREGGHPRGPGAPSGLCTKLACGGMRQGSDLLRAARICLTVAALAGFVAAVSVLSRCPRLVCVGRVPGLLISAAASFAAGLSGLAAMVLYTLDEPGHAAAPNVTWTFCLAWLVFTLYIVTGVFSLVTQVLYPEPGPQRCDRLVPDGRLCPGEQNRLAGE